MTVIKNIVETTSVCSTLVYPNMSSYKRICKVDKEWITAQLRMTFGSRIKSISNKYVISINDKLYYNRDGNIWLLEKK